MITLTKPNIIVNVNPTYKCNCNCNYCYLGNLRELINILPLNLLEEKLTQLSTKFNISHIDYFGGEISILPSDYLNKSYQIMKKYTESISTISNGLYINDVVLNNVDDITLSYNSRLKAPFLKEYIKQKLNNKNVHILSLYFGDENDWSPKEFLNIMNDLNVCSVKIIEYCDSLTNPNKKIKNYNEKYEEFIYNCINEYKQGDYNFILVNFLTIQSILNDTYTILPESVYITPQGNFGVLKHKNNVEYFEDIEFKNIDRYLKNIHKTYEKNCLTCEYYNKCLYEHYTNKCCGHKQLLNKFK